MPLPIPKCWNTDLKAIQAKQGYIYIYIYPATLIKIKYEYKNKEHFLHLGYVY